MVLHTFAIRYKSETTQAEKDRALAEMLTFQGKVPGLLETHAGRNFPSRANGFDYGAVMKFTSRAALEAYLVSPLHQQFLAWVGPLVAQAQDIDFEA